VVVTAADALAETAAAKAVVRVAAAATPKTP
jgi:hypothetical protein